MRPLLLLVALLAIAPDVAAAAAWQWPVRGEVITQYRNGEDPYSAGQHRGIDIAAPVGTAVVAATGGTVEFAGPVGSAGLTVSQRTGDGRHRISYLHLSRVDVERGEAVSAGERLGEVGVSGERSASAPHLHLGVRAAGERHAYLDPLRFLGPSPATEPPVQPRPVPVPVPAAEPARPAPAPAPAPVAAPSPAPVPSSGPVSIPLPGPARAPRREPGRARVPGPASPAAAPGRALARTLGAAAGPAPAGDRRPARQPAEPAAPSSGPAAEPVRAGRAGPASPAAKGAERGFDAGWLAACAGLVAAASLLAGSRGARRGHAPVRTAFGALLRAASRG